MNSKIRLITIVCVSLLLTSCIGFEERVFIHKDGTGTYTFTLDMTQMIEKMKVFFEAFSKALDSTITKSDEKPKEQDTNPTDEAFNNTRDKFIFERDKMNSIKGVHDFKEFSDTANGKYKYGCGFNFVNVTALNAGLKNLFQKKGKGKKSEGMPAATYKFEDGVLSRELTKEQVEDFGGKSKEEEKMAKALLKDFKYIIIVESDNAISNVIAPGAKITKQSKRVELDYDILNKDKEITKSKMRSEFKVY